VAVVVVVAEEEEEEREEPLAEEPEPEKKAGGEGSCEASSREELGEQGREKSTGEEGDSMGEGSLLLLPLLVRE
jgi:hypothetical protein